MDMKPARFKSTEAEKMKEMFLAAQAGASDHHTAIAHWENLISPPKVVDSNEVEQTRSEITLKHIRKLLEWRYPVLEQAFLAKEDLYAPKGRDEYDGQLAQFHRTLLNYQLNNEMDKTTIITRAVRAYMNQATAIGYLGWNMKKEKALQIDAIFGYGFVAKSSPMYEVLEKEYIEINKILSEHPNRKTSIPLHMVEGASHYAKYSSVKDVTIKGFTQNMSKKDVLIANHPTINILNVYDVYGAPECKTNLQDSPYVFYKYPEYIYELQRNDDYDTKNIDWTTVEAITPAGNAGISYDAGDVRNQVEVIEFWGMYDLNNDGQVEPCRVLWVDGHILEAIPNPYPDKKHPFYSAAYLPAPKLDTFYGESDALLVEDNQAILSAMHRGFIDIHGNSAYGQKGVAKDVLDPVNRDKFLRGENFEYDSNVVDPNALFQTFDFPDIAQSAIAYVSMLNADSEALTGIKGFNEGISGNSYGDTAAGVKGLLSATALRETSITNRLAQMFIAMGKRIMYLNTLYLDKEKILSLLGREGMIVKSILNPLIDVKVDISNQAEDNLKAQEMSFMLQTLGNTIPPKLAQVMLQEIARLRNMQTLENEIKLYEEEPPQPSEAEQEIQALQIELLKAQIANEKGRARQADSSANLNESKIPNEQAKTAKTEAETKEKEVQTERVSSGQETKDKISIISAQAESNISAAVFKERQIRGNGNNVPSQN
ncbi:coil containing protein [Vibrio phage 1.188.A._10N.286.51.A6]|uniref:Coil containing protein n=3 Tax=Mukerjeevirus mv51A6 TaxID=2734162 RepID=A0A2I7RJ01_9CAUD|nr:portal protein [Vibrio phage 1.188.A._10N.286.51.A6]AUR93613.1 coil containing protein [Vibrio phage 1.188.A._10N.286.51.A6]AUR93699.1 coil containing protein [Vibrio phage 1.188.B._10N.286.51.A6]AUR93785.1 coil containing protein [Vibrio phage 1.188.C._10N.286.51.A6]